MIVKEEVKLGNYNNVSRVCVKTFVGVTVIIGYARVHQDTVYHVKADGSLGELVYLRRDQVGPVDLYNTTFSERKSMVKAKTYRNMRLLLDKTLEDTVINDCVYQCALEHLHTAPEIYVVVFGMRDDRVARLEIGETKVPIPVRYAKRPCKSLTYQ
jgi:hypothetical protein